MTQIEGSRPFEGRREVSLGVVFSSGKPLPHSLGRFRRKHTVTVATKKHGVVVNPRNVS